MNSFRSPFVRLLMTSTALVAVVTPSVAQSLPTGGSVASGGVSIAGSATTLTIQQTTPNAVVNWNSFSIGQGNTVTINQPSVSSAILNRVTGTTPSTIAGALNATGQAYLINPNGIAITKSGTVTVGGGFVASTLGMSDDEFNNGRRRFTGTGASAGISNAGVITVGRGGYAALLGGKVDNAGAIAVPMGKVALGSGEAATLDVSGDGFLQVAVPTSDGGKSVLIRQRGTIKAEGGAVILSAATARAAARGAVTMSGEIDAHSISGHSGSITIGGGEGGAVKVSGKLDVSGDAATPGGSVAVTGQTIALKGATIDASGAKGGHVAIGSEPLATAEPATSIAMDAASTIRANGMGGGRGGRVALNAAKTITLKGAVTAQGGPTGRGGAIKVTSPEGSVQVAAGATLDASAGAAGRKGGRIAVRAGAAAGGVVDLSGTLAASAAGGVGGEVAVSGRLVLPSGAIHADGVSGGKVALEGTGLTQSGAITATGTTGSGGAVTITARANLIQTATAVTAADSATGAGGSVTLTGAGIGSVFSSGTVTATGGTGGSVTVTGVNIALAAATLDASGTAKGGTILVGGDLHGTGPDTATTTLVNAATVLAADAKATGDGGKVVVWSNQQTTFLGTVTAQGGAQGGNGGAIEVSSGDTLAYAGNGNAGAAHGAAGTLLLDPKNIIVGGGGTTSYGLVDPDAGQGSGFGTQTVQLSNGTIVVTKPYDTVGGATGAGSVFFFNGATGALTATFQGSTAGDNVGSGGLLFLNYTNYANYYVNYTTPTLVNDTTKAFLILSPNWHSSMGAVTWVGANSTVSGVLSSSNSLVGSTAGDGIGAASSVQILPNNNYVDVAPQWSGGKGAVTFGSASAGVSGVVSSSNSLVGSTANDTTHTPFQQAYLPGDEIGAGGLVVLANGNFLVDSPYWNKNAGAVTFVNASTGATGVVGSSNSLVGQTSGTLYSATYNYFGTTGTNWGYYNGDNIGPSTYNIYLLSNGNYAVASPNWSHGRGAVTVGSATAGVSGVVSSTNSLVGTTAGIGDTNDGGGNTYATSVFGNRYYYGGDAVGSSGVTTLPVNGNYLISSPNWSANKGAVTFASIATPVTGAVSSSNSLVGSTSGTASGYDSYHQNYISGGDQVGAVTALSNGNYVVSTTSWNNGLGAVTWASGSTGRSGAISSSNSLVGSTAGDTVGSNGIVLLPGNANSDYVVLSSVWSSGKGAVTRVSGTTGLAGPITASNSIVGTTGYTLGNVGGDTVGSGGIVGLPNNEWVILSPNWGATKGAVTLMTASQATSGTLSAGNSLVGSTPGTTYTSGFGPAIFGGDAVGSGGITILANSGGSNFVVASPAWGTNKGAVTFVNASAALNGAVSSTNSLVGANAGTASTNTYSGYNYRYYIGGDSVGSGGVAVLPNNNYVVLSPNWSLTRGAVTFGSGASGTTGTVGSANSLVGSTAGTAVTNSGYTSYTGGDQVGNGYYGSSVQILTGSSFLVNSSTWASGKGAVTWESGTAVFSGVVSASNSLVGAAAGDGVGSTLAKLLSNGNYLITSTGWNGGMGAVTFGAAGSAVTGIISSSNSLVGSTAGDYVGNGGITVLSGNDYVVASPSWNGGLGAATWSGGTGALTGVVGTANSITGSSAGNNSLAVSTLSTANQFLVALPSDGSGSVNFVETDLTPATAFATLSAQTVTVGAGLLVQTLNTGTSVVLQANNDITVNSAIATSAGSTASLTLDAGRSLLINAGINVGNGNLILTANETLANGVVDAQRSSGAAAITVASGAALSAGTGTVSLILAAGTGKTNSTAGNISISSAISGASITVENLGAQNGSVALQSGASLTASGSNTAILVETGGAFTNNAGSSALSAGAGRWLVYSATSAGDTFGGLNSNNNAVWNTAVGASVSATGNRYVFAQQPAVTVTTTNASKTYGADASSAIQSNYTVTGQAAVAGAYLGDTTGLATGVPLLSSTGAAATAAVLAGGYTITGAAGTLAVTAAGYSATPTFANTGKLTINPAALTITAADQTATYGTPYTLSTAPTTGYVASGLLNSDTITGLTEKIPGNLTATTASTPATTYTITPSAATGTGLSNYTITYATGTLTVNPAILTTSITYSVANAQATYGTLAVLGAATLTGVTAGDAANVSGTVGAFTGGGAAVTLAANTPVGSYVEKVTGLTGSAAANYTVATSGNSNGALVIVPLAVQLSGSQTYNGTSSVSGANLSVGNLVAGDSVTVGGTGTMAGKDVVAGGTQAIAALAGLTLSSGNYTVTGGSGAVTVTPAALTVTAANQTATYGTSYALNTVPTTGYTASGLQGSDAITGLTEKVSIGGVAVASTTANSAAGSYAITPSAATGLTAANYTITYATTGALTVNPLAVQLSGSQTYNGTTAVVGANLSVGNLVAGDSVTVGGTGTMAGKDVVAGGTQAIASLTGLTLSNGNYTVTGGSGAVTVTPAALTIAAANQTATYGTAYTLSTAPTTGYTASGLQGSDAITGLTERVSIGGVAVSSTTANSAAGSYAITPSAAAGLTAANYTITYAATGALTVNPLAVQLSGSQVYNGTTSVSGANLSVSNLVAGDVVTVGGTGTMAGKDVVVAGTQAIASLAGLTLSSGNYTVTGGSGAVTVTPAALTVTAANQAATYGTAYSLSTAPTAGYTASGLQGSDTITGLTERVSIGGAAVSATTANSAAGSYAITPSAAAGLTAANYTITYAATGTLTVNPLAVQLSGSQTYNGTSSVSGANLGVANLVAGDAVTVGGTGTMAGKDVVAGGTQAMASLAGLTLSSGNYTVTGGSGAVTVTPAALTVTAANQTATYGTPYALNTAPAGYIASGLQGSDAITGLTEKVSIGGVAVASTTANSAAGSYAITPSAITGLTAANYAVTYAGTGRLTVNPLAVILTGTQVYTGGTQVSGANLAVGNLVAGDSVTVGGAATMAAKDVVVGGREALTSLAGLTIGNANYTLAGGSGAVTVTPAPLTITAANQTTVYGAPFTLDNGATGYSVSGLLAGDTIGSVTQTLNGFSGSIAGAPAGSYAIRPSAAAGTGVTNYAITYATGTLTVAPAALTITASNQSKIYGAVAALGTCAFTTAGLLNGDAVSAVALASPGSVASASVAGGPYAINATGAQGTGLANYVITYNAGLLTVTPRALTITADDQTRPANSANPPLTYTLGGSGLAAGDVLTGALATTAGTTSASGRYPILVGSLAASGDYAVTYLPGTLTIEQAATVDTPVASTQVLAIQQTSTPALLTPPAINSPPPSGSGAGTASQTVPLLSDPRFDSAVVDGTVTARNGQAPSDKDTPTP